MRTLSFVVPGKPVSQGWLKPVRTKDGRTFMRNAKEPELRDYRARVAMAAAAVGAVAVDGPVSITVTFVFPRPKNHFGSGRNSHVLKPSAPEWVATMPDVDKTLRALFDALTNVAVLDDKQFVQVSASKVFTSPLHPTPVTEVAIAYLTTREEVSVV